jgi:type IV fimbrial biogenesis protein FimT
MSDVHCARGRGFSLVELLVVMGIIALLAGLGWPGITRQRAEAAVRVATDRTMAALQTARQRALTTGRSVTVCPSADGRRCGFGAAGWMLFENQPGGSDAIRDAGEAVVQRWQMPAQVVAGGTRGYASYQPQTSAASTVTLEVCHLRQPRVRRSVIISQTGRARVSRPGPASIPAGQGCR